MDNLTGRVIKTYELREQLGAGGFGAVYRAYQQVVGREVAIKVILPEYANHPDFIYRFEAEAQLIARLEHPHIVPLYDYWREPDGAYLVMRWLRASLRAELKNGPWCMEATARLLDQLAGALTVAHRHSIIHRDIKPDNILLDDECNAYLADFGIAKNLGTTNDATQQGLLLGSPMYFTPEQIRGEPVTPQSDLYSLGIVLYEILVGEKPFSPDLSLTALIAKHLNDPLPDLFSRCPEAPAALNAVIQRTTAKVPTDRYPTALALAEAFHQAMDGSQVSLNILVMPKQPIPASPEDATVLETVITTDNPYKGLRAFQEADASDFFGREALTKQLLKRLAETGEGSRFLAVVGPSGSGKSSVVRAGLIPALRNGTLPGSNRWFIVEMIPGPHPFEELEGALLRVAVNPPATLLAQLREDERGLVRALKRVLPGDETSELVLVIDQFEEVFTLVESEAERLLFLNSLLAAVNDARSRLRVIVTLRADFYDRPLLYTGFGSLMERRTQIVIPLSSQELEQAIVRPAERMGVRFQIGLLAAIVNDVAEQPGVLPLLQYALTELFERRNGERLTQEAYQLSGGVPGALARRAEELYGALTPLQQNAARQVFLRLVTLGEGIEDTRRRVKRTELASLGLGNDALNHVVEVFSQYRLLTFDRDPITREPTVEVAHEALIRTWQRLREWLDESREAVRLQRRLMLSAAEWRSAGHDPSFLASGVRLTQFETLAHDSKLALNDEEQAYLRASIAERASRQQAEESRTARELATQRQSANRLRWLVVALALFLVVALGLSGLAFDSRNRAVANAEIAANNAATATVAQGQALDSLAQYHRAVSSALTDQANRLLNSDNPNPELAVLLEIRALQTAYRPDAESILTNALARTFTVRLFRGHQQDATSVSNISYPGWISTSNQEITSVAMSSSGRYIVTGSLDNTARLWDTQTGAELQTFKLPTNVTSVAISPDEKYVLTGSYDNSAQLWDIQTGQPVLRFGKPQPNLAISSVAFSPDGKWVLTGSADTTARLWDVQTGQPFRQFTGHAEIISSVAFSPDGKWVLTGSADTTARLWDVQTGQVLHTFQDTGGILSAAFSPDGQRVVTSNLNNAIVWDLKTYNQLKVLNIPQTHILMAAFNSDSTSVLLAGAGGTAWLVNAQSGRKIRSYIGHTQNITGAVFSADGKYLLTGSIDGTARLWSVTTSPGLRQFTGQLIIGTSSALSPNGKLAFSSDGQYGVIDNNPGLQRLWGLATSMQMTDTGSAQSPIIFSPDQKLALIIPRPVSTGDAIKAVQLLDAKTGQTIRTFSGDTARVHGAAFSPDGRSIVTFGDDMTVRLWDVQTGQELRQFLGHTDAITDVVFAPNGKTILTTSNDLTARLWDVQTGQVVTVLSGHTDAVVVGAFSHDGMQVVTASLDSTARLWDVQTGQERRRFVNPPTFYSGVVYPQTTLDIAFSPDDKYVVTIDGGVNTSRLWDVQTGQELRDFLSDSHGGSILYRPNKVSFSPDGRFIVTSLMGGIYLWNTDIRDLYAFACTRVFRDFSAAERAAYGIPDNDPTCPQFATSTDAAATTPAQ